MYYFHLGLGNHPDSPPRLPRRLTSPAQSVDPGRGENLVSVGGNEGSRSSSLLPANRTVWDSNKKLVQLPVFNISRSDYSIPSRARQPRPLGSGPERGLKEPQKTVLQGPEPHPDGYLQCRHRPHCSLEKRGNRLAASPVHPLRPNREQVAIKRLLTLAADSPRVRQLVLFAVP